MFYPVQFQSEGDILIMFSKCRRHASYKSDILFHAFENSKKKKEKAVSSLEIIIPVAEKSYCLENKI